jgi:hypothetical protein
MVTIYVTAHRDCPKRVCWVVIRYSSTHEKDIPNRPLRRRVGVHRASPAYSKGCREAPGLTPCARSSTPSSTSCVAAVPGVCCRTSFRLGRPSITTSEFGASTVPGSDYTLCSAPSFASTPQERSSTERGHSGFPVGEDHRRGRRAGREWPIPPPEHLTLEQLSKRMVPLVETRRVLSLLY